jgi:hypothetical protein
VGSAPVPSNPSSTACSCHPPALVALYLGKLTRPHFASGDFVREAFADAVSASWGTEMTKCFPLLLCVCSNGLAVYMAGRAQPLPRVIAWDCLANVAAWRRRTSSWLMVWRPGMCACLLACHELICDPIAFPLGAAGYVQVPEDGFRACGAELLIHRLTEARLVHSIRYSVLIRLTLS